MKAVRAPAGEPVLVDVPRPDGDGVLVKVVSASICGSDLHMLDAGWLGRHTIGHEFAGIAEDGTAVAVEPTLGCGICGHCDEGLYNHCEQGFHLMGVMSDGGMAEYVRAPAANLVRLPTGLDIATAALVEPLAVAFHGLDRCRLDPRDRVLVLGAGPIGLAAVAALAGRGMSCDISARYPHQQAAALGLGAGLEAGEGYDLVIDAVGSEDSLAEAVRRLKPLGRLGLLGSFWEKTGLGPEFCMKEVELLPASTYSCRSPRRNFEEAARLLQAKPEVAEALVTHRFPLDAVTEAFAVARDRRGGAIKVVFDVAAGH
ncbi:MAG: alcohol dehydrogenase catalytic domain-containing protein [Halieaceae bacterium]|jgi:threonine dehydrogenase-like Zn-dependent dehydrogenase|nr:alcohol dehydrogenase catalytic domain-containing protein [Halieaceae bacterium]